MMDFDKSEMAEAFEKAFGRPISEATVEQARFMVCMAKHVRGRCRSNSALNNYLNRNFTGLRFTEVEKEWNGKTYPSLEITKR